MRSKKTDAFLSSTFIKSYVYAVLVLKGMYHRKVTCYLHQDFYYDCTHLKFMSLFFL